MVGVRIPGLVVAVRDDDLRLGPTDDRDQAADGFVEICLVEAVRMLVRRRVGHTGVAIAEHLDLVEADDGG